MAQVPALIWCRGGSGHVSLLEFGVGLSDTHRSKRTPVRFYSRSPHTAWAPASPISTTPTVADTADHDREHGSDHRQCPLGLRGS